INENDDFRSNLRELVSNLYSCLLSINLDYQWMPEGRDYHNDLFFSLIFCNHKDIIEKYNQIFIYLLYINHTKRLLADLWLELHKHARCEWTFMLNVFIRECLHVMENIMNFTNTQIHYHIWEKHLVHKITYEMTNIFDFETIHREFVDMLLETCFLHNTQQELRKCIKKWMDTIHQLISCANQLILSTSSETTLESTTEIIQGIAHLRREFQMTSKFVTKLLQQLSQTRTGTNAINLLTHLDFNRFYELC
ncbi:hypothetical protein RFI_07030, partial [Reticulomyxa filosa]